MPRYSNICNFFCGCGTLLGWETQKNWKNFFRVIGSTKVLTSKSQNLSNASQSKSDFNTWKHFCTKNNAVSTFLIIARNCEIKSFLAILHFWHCFHLPKFVLSITSAAAKTFIALGQKGSLFFLLTYPQNGGFEVFMPENN